MDTVTILIPLYNGIEYLSDCIQSIQNQIYTNWIVIIGVNGHSVYSSTFRQAQVYASDKIQVKHYSTEGKSATLNEMVKDIPDDNNIVCLLDADDYWHPEKLARQMELKSICGYDVIGTQCYYVRDTVQTQEMPSIKYGRVYFQDLLKCNHIINSSCMINKCDAYWEGDEGLEDYNCWLSLSKANKTFFNIDTPLVYHRLHSTSFYNTRNHQYVDALLKKFR
jgi:glycosyltransferase involved in cell wall biosynthesis